jgi:hypothetical protein
MRPATIRAQVFYTLAFLGLLPASIQLTDFRVLHESHFHIRLPLLTVTSWLAITNWQT